MSTVISPQITYAAVLGKVVQSNRERSGKSQAEVAAILGISQSAYSKWEVGDTTLSVLQLRTLAQLFGTDPGTMMADVEGWIFRLNQQNVTVVSAREVPKAALLVGLGVLAGLLAISTAAS